VSRIGQGLVVVLVIVGAAGVGATSAATATAGANATTPRIVAVYPNPVAHGDTGEFLTLSVPDGTDLGTYRLGDDDSETALPNWTVGGRVVLTANESAVPDSVDGPVLEVEGLPALANGGETLGLSGPGGNVATVRYADAPEGEVLRPSGDRRWRPLGATAFEPIEGSSGTARAFTLPDAPDVPLAVLDRADRRLLLAGYTLTSERVVDRLIAARKRGVTVEVLVDGAPVGGLTNRSAAALDRLVAANVTVTVLGGENGRYRFHHAKYAVVDDQAVVLTENWKPAGTGGASSRGWGAVVDTAAVVDGLVRTFRADSDGRGARPWERFREDATIEPGAPTSGRYPTRIEPRRVNVERTELLVAPDNAASRVGDLLANATDSIRIVQMSIGGRDDRLLRETIAAAERGVDVQILLSSAWYAREDNRQLVADLRKVAGRDGVELSVRLADPGGRYEKIHAKGVIIDGDTVVLGSLNWNDNAYENNREVALVLHGRAVGSYFGEVFERDWRGGITLVPAGSLAAPLIAAMPAALLVRRIEFGE